MKSRTTPIGKLLILLMIIFSLGCKKENFTQDMVGTYTGIAKVKSVPDYILRTYPNCQVKITRIDPILINVDVTLDPTSAVYISHDALVKDPGKFEKNGSGGPRSFTLTMKGTLNGPNLQYEYYYNSFGSTSTLTFEGIRN